MKKKIFGRMGKHDADQPKEKENTTPEFGDQPDDVIGLEEALTKELETNAELEETREALSDLKDKHLRLMAEFDNYKKRTTKERIDLINSASKEVMAGLLPVLDDFDRAKKSADDPTTDEKFSEGVALVYNRLKQILQQQGLKPMESTGEAFDPELHDAITEIPAPDPSLAGKVIDTVEKGYFLHDKLIRHAKVVVGK